MNKNQGRFEKKNTELEGLIPHDSLCQLDVFGHDCGILSMHGAHVGILKQVHHVVLCSLLQCQDGRHLKSCQMKKLMNILSESLEGCLNFTWFQL